MGPGRVKHTKSPYSSPDISYNGRPIVDGIAVAFTNTFALLKSSCDCR